MTAPNPLAGLTTFDVRTPSACSTVIIGTGAAGRLPELIAPASLPARRFIVSNPTVWRLHGPVLARASREHAILIPDGERFKNHATPGRIYEALIRGAADRATTIVAAGGGVVGDVAGFAAATYLRGVPVVQVPTTLLAQVDSAIGGKVGVNHALGKNLIGAFHQPSLVVIDPDLLKTLPRREFRAGLYEVIKYGVIASRDLFDRLRTSIRALFDRDAAALAPVIIESCRIKASVVEQDERESGLRRMLNFGHTIGHALEAVTKYKRFRHGEAVAYGMLAAAHLGVKRGTLVEADRAALAALIASMGPLPAVSDLEPGPILEAVSHDKKVLGGQLHFVLPAGIGGVTTVTDISRTELKDAVAAIRKV